MKRIAIIIAAAIVFAIALRFVPLAGWLRQFQDYVHTLGPSGYVLYAAVYAICVVFLVPASLLTLGAGALFGVVGGTIVVTIGATLGATLAFILGRTVLRERVQAATANSPRLRAVDAAIAGEGTRLMLLMRLSGFPPFTWINYALGLTGVRLVPYVWTTFIGIIPGAIALTYAGAAGAAAASGGGNRVALLVTAAGAVVVSLYVARIAARAIRRAGVSDSPS